MEKGNKLYHKLDKFIGIPIVFVLGLFKLRKRKIPIEINRIAILNLGSIGDNVLMSGPIKDLRKSFPDASIEIFTGSSNFQVVQMIPGVNVIHRLTIKKPFQTITQIKALDCFDVVLDFGPWPRINAIYTFLISSKCSIGFRTHKQYRHYLYDIIVDHLNTVHEIDNQRNLIKIISKQADSNPLLEINYQTINKEVIDSFNDFCIIHPWSAGLRKVDKQWDYHNWLELCERISNDFKNIILTGGPSDVEDSSLLLMLIKSQLPNCPIVSLAGQLSIQETSYLITKAKMNFCIDTGIAHIAAAFGKKLICLQGPAKSLRWRPYNVNTIVVNPSKGRFGYLSLGFEKNPDNTNCMENISVNAVYKAYLQVK
jgi:ADP-heptose:LPS heptosyltransferase